MFSCFMCFTVRSSFIYSIQLHSCHINKLSWVKNSGDKHKLHLRQTPTFNSSTRNLKTRLFSTSSWFLVHPASKTHWPTRFHQLCLSSAASCTSSHPIPIFLRCLLKTLLQFWRGRPDLLLKPSGSQWRACRRILWHSMPERCPSRLSRLHLITSSNLGSAVASLTFS